MNNLREGGLITNLIGMTLILLSVSGIVSMWWGIGSFTGSWTQVISVGIAGAVFIGGLTDDFLRDIRASFRKRQGLKEKADV